MSTPSSEALLSTIDLEFDAPLDEIERLLAPWLWEWLWPWSAGDRLSEPPSLALGLELQPASVLHLLEGDDGLVLFRDPLAGAVKGTWIVALDGEAPAMIGLWREPGISRLRIRLHPRLASSERASSFLAGKLKALRVFLRPRHAVVADGLLHRKLDDGTHGDRFYALLDLHLSAEASDRNNGAWLTPLAARRARWIPAASDALRDAIGAGPLNEEESFAVKAVEEDISILLTLNRPEEALTTRAVVDEYREEEPTEGVPRLLGMPETPCAGLDGLAAMLSEDGSVVTMEGDLGRLLSWLRERATREPWLIGVLRSEEIEGKLTDVAPPASGLPWPSTAFFVRGQGYAQLVSRRLMEWGPWLVERPQDDVSFALLHDPDASQRAAFAELWEAGDWLQGLFLPAEPTLPEEVAEYDPEARALFLWVEDAPPTSQDLAHVVAFARLHREGSRVVERVIASIANPVLARLWLPFLWLREVEVWTSEAGAWTRIDQDYAPGWGLPPWARRWLSSSALVFPPAGERVQDGGDQAQHQAEQQGVPEAVYDEAIDQLVRDQHDDRVDDEQEQAEREHRDG